MKILDCNEAAIGQVAAVLKSGGVAVIPTDTVYGLAAHPGMPGAVERLWAVKSRSQSKPIALLASDANGAERYVGRRAAEVGGRYWPGALTVVANGEGVRVPDHDWTRRLIAECGGALRVTSANLSGGSPSTDAVGALEALGQSVDVVVDGGASRGGAASTVVEVGEAALKILRPGPVEFLTLASGSPRRAKILAENGVDFTIRPSGAEEVCHPEDPERTVRENAQAKGGPGRVLSADTIVWLDGRIYGKPRDLAEAREFLRALSGRIHTVFTGVAFNGEVRVVKSEVKVRDMSEADIEEYIARVNPLDRAGAYDIDESGGLVVESYTGSYENIMGLPLEPLKEWGIVK